MRLQATVVHVPWSAPLATADSATSEPRPLILVRLAAADGTVGYGEAAPLEHYDGVSVDMVLAALDTYRSVLPAVEAAAPAAVVHACAERAPLRQALAAVDLALWDMAGQRAGAPVWSLLAGVTAPTVEVNAVIGAVGPRQAGAEACDAVRSGFRCVKVKVGTDTDIPRVQAVRAAIGPDISLRIDANGAWGTVDAAVAALNRLAASGIELCEEPVHGAAAIAAVAAATPIPIAVDESTSDPAVFASRVAHAVCLKVSASGGISGLITTAQRARKLGYEVFVASTLDGPLGIAAAAHASAAFAPDRACGLATLDRFARPVPFSVKNGRLSPPAGPGLGDGLLGWYLPT